jgi:hypothetical protein
VATPVPAQERLRRWLCGSFPFGRRPYAGSRVQLTEGCMMHNSGRGDVLSSRVPTTPGMVLQRSGWWHSGGDGCTGPTVTEGTRSTGPTSRRRPRAGTGETSVPLSRVPLSSFEGAARQPYRSGWYNVTELTLVLPHSVVQWRGWTHKEGWRNNTGI